MGFFHTLKQKIADGWLRELTAELSWSWQYVRRYRWMILVHILIGTVGILFSLMGSITLKFLVDAVAGNRLNVIWSAGAWMLGLLLGTILMKYCAGRIGASMSIKIQNEIRQEVYRKVLFADWQSLEEFRSGDLLTRLNSDVNVLAGAVIGFVPALISGVIQFFGSLIIICCYDPAMALIALLGVPFSAICSRLLLRRMREYDRDMKKLSSELLSFHQNSFQNLTIIKTFGIAELFSGKLAHMQNHYRDTYLSYNRFSLRTSALLSLVGILISMCCLGWSVYRLWTGVITFGTMALFLQLAAILASASSALLGLIPSLISMSTSAGRIMAVTELPAEEMETKEVFRKETEFAVSLSEIDFSYQDGVPLLSHATIHVGTGDLIALTGPSGEGKTTILRILLGLVRPTAGSAELIGGSGQHYPLSAGTRSAFSYVPQGASLFSGTIAENLRMAAPGATEEEMWAALHTACADDFVRELPDGLCHRIGDRDSGLSEGQAQRLAVARALLRGAPVLLLDEATSALDTDTEAEMLRRLMEGKQVRACILVTHRTHALQYCTGGYRIHDGLVTEER